MTTQFQSIGKHRLRNCLTIVRGGAGVGRPVGLLSQTLYPCMHIGLLQSSSFNFNGRPLPTQTINPPAPPASIKLEQQPLIQQISQAFSIATGYSEVEKRKIKVQEKDQELTLARDQLDALKQKYEQAIQNRKVCQKQLNSLLQRKDAWMDADAVQFTELFRKDILLEQEEDNARSAYKQANEIFDKTHMEYLNEIRERYVDEQLYSDKIRQASTWWTMGLISFHFLVFVLVTLREPGNKRRNQEKLLQALDESAKADREILMSNVMDVVKPSSQRTANSDTTTLVERAHSTSIPYLGLQIDWTGDTWKGFGLGMGASLMAFLAGYFFSN